jgi:ATP-dependent DNA helicase RecQ
VVTTLFNESIVEALLPQGAKPKPEQERAIGLLLAGKNTLCLMPTGSGKSFIYQYPAAHLGKTALILSPLRALMSQQDDIMERSGFTSSALHELSDYRKYIRALRAYANGDLPQFLYISPERAASDGLLANVLQRQRERIGLVVIDEVHCISQWGETFRPLYRLIPSFIQDIFGPTHLPTVLGLTATLKSEDESEVCRIFGISGPARVRSTLLRRTNISISVEHLSDHDEKERRLEEILGAHSTEKVIVYAHLVSNRQYGTRALTEKFKAKGFACDYFDAQASEPHKAAVVDGFSTGKLPIIFATSAFGMGMHIPDIRAVVHYLLPESIEQYYQEIGRAGRDEEPSSAYLLFTETNLKVRRDLLRRSLPTAPELDDIYEENFAPSGSVPFVSYDPYRDTSENSRELSVFVALLEAGVLQIRGKGVSNIKCFAAAGPSTGALRQYLASSKTGSVSMIAAKTQQDPSTIMHELYQGVLDGTISISSAPTKVVFYTHSKPYEECREAIAADFGIKRERREARFEELVKVINSSNPETGIYSYLGI